MDLLSTDEQQAVQDALADVLSALAPLEVARRYRPGDHPSPVWDALSEMGLFGLGVPDSAGGAGMGLPELGLAFREIGRWLTPGPVLGTVLAARLAARAGEQAVLKDLLAGERAVGLGVPAPSGGVRLIDAVDADWILFVSPDGAEMVAGADVAMTSRCSLDASVHVADAAAADTAHVRIVDRTGMAWWEGALLVAAQHVGIAEATRDLAVGHALSREQFGKVIGSFQAVKHRCAEMATRAEVARFQTIYAALVDGSDKPSQVSAARLVAEEAARENAADLIVTWGAMGFSDESVAHLFARRSAVLGTMFGTERWHLESLARQS